MKPGRSRRIWLYSGAALWLIGAAAIAHRMGALRNAQLVASAGSVKRPVAELLAPLPQPFAKVLGSMYRHELQMGTDGATHELTKDTGVWASDGMYIYDLCRRVRPAHTAEVGLAEGFSTVFFLAAAATNGTGSHVAIDPFENSQWHGLGLKKVEEVGMKDHFRFLETMSIYAVPQLAAEHVPYQVIFIDGDHRFDAEMTDFVLADNLCAKGGYLLFHDIWMASTQKLALFLENNRPDYKRVETGTDIAAFQKVGDDHRDWRWFQNF